MTKYQKSLSMKIKLKDIKVNPKNPRLVKDEKFKKLCSSIKEFPKMMELRPIVIDEDNTILGGNMRYKALKELGFTEVPKEWIKKASELTEDEKKRFIISDNVPFGEWSWDLLESDFDLQELEDWGVDIFDFEEPEKIEAVEDNFNEPITEKAKTVLGDLYEIGVHRLLCGDSTCSDSVAKLMNGEKADMVFTDPPYGMNLDTNYADIYKNSIANVKNQDRIIGDDKDFNFIDFYALFEYVEEQFWWGADYYQNQLPSNGAIFVWDKVCESMEGRIGNEFELCWSKQRHKKEIIHIKWAGFVEIQKKAIKDLSKAYPGTN
jgi:hypothetical protein